MRSGPRLLGVLIALIIGFLLLLLFWRVVSAESELGYNPPRYSAVVTGPHTASLSLQAYPDNGPCHPSSPHPDWVSYCPSTTLRVPANSVITVTIKQYDSGTPLHNNFFERVMGTVGGVEQVDGKTVKGLNSDASEIGHTFTIQSAPDSPEPLFVSVPVAGVANNAPNKVTIGGTPYPAPRVVVFRFRTGKPGRYIWKCYDPCGTGLYGDNDNFGGPMATIGYMAGTMTVV